MSDIKVISAADLCAIIEEKFDWDSFKSMVFEEGGGEEEFEEATGLKFEMYSDERSEGSGDWDGWEWVWKAGDCYYRHEGSYSSWDGRERPSISSFERVIPTEVVMLIFKSARD